jgi:ribA/ribD-fused uncharacterized protein
MQDQQHLVDLQQQACERMLDYIYFWNQPVQEEVVSKACFSQWYPSAFVVNEVQYATAEHWMMAGKANLFDPSMIDQILANPDPAVAKLLGRKIKHFDEAVWRSCRFDIVVAGNLAKFSQHPALREMLLNTGDHILVEASPVDRIWGIGLSEFHRKAKHPSTWQGLNLLGFALMRVREQLQTVQ